MNSIAVGSQVLNDQGSLPIFVEDKANENFWKYSPVITPKTPGGFTHIMSPEKKSPSSTIKLSDSLSEPSDCVFLSAYGLSKEFLEQEKIITKSEETEEKYQQELELIGETKGDTDTIV